MTPKRIGIAGWILAWGPSGATRRLEALTEAAIIAGYNVTFFTPTGITPPPGIATCGAEIVPVPITICSTWQRTRIERRILPALVHDHKLDLFHLPHAPAPKLPIPVSLTIHDLRDFTRHARPGRRLMAPLLWRSALRHANILLAVSEYSAGELDRLLPRLTPRTHIVPTSLPQRFHTTCEAKLPPTFPTDYLLTTGRPLPHKNPRMLINAYASLRQQNPLTPPLLQVGESHDHRCLDLTTLIKKHQLENHIILTGPVAEEMLPAIYARAKVAIFPSLYEGQGLGPLEAMAGGAPVLVSAIPAHQEIAGPGAQLFAPDKPDALAKIINQLLDNQDLATTLAAQGKMHVAKYTPQRMAKKLMAAWQ